LGAFLSQDDCVADDQKRLLSGARPFDQGYMRFSDAEIAGQKITYCFIGSSVYRFSLDLEATSINTGKTVARRVWRHVCVHRNT